MNKFIVILALLFLIGCDISLCPDKECFIEKANNCGQATLEEQEAYALVKYEAKDCTLTKTILQMDPNEEEQLRNLIEGKSLTCTYQSELNTRWMYSLYAAIEECDGELKDILQQLIVVA